LAWLYINALPVATVAVGCISQMVQAQTGLESQYIVKQHMLQ
jgi:hypothetical protein